MRADVIEEMRALGHDADVWPDYPVSNATVCCIKVAPLTAGLRHAAADPRCKGYSRAW